MAAAQGRLQDGLQAAPGALPTVTLCEHAGDAASALAGVAEQRLSFVVLDMSCGGYGADTASADKVGTPGTGCSVLTDDLRRLGVASSDGTDAVVLQGTPPTEHFETITRLLDRHEDLGATTADGE